MSSNYYRVEFIADTNGGYDEEYIIFAIINNTTDDQSWYNESGYPIELLRKSDDYMSKLWKALSLIGDDDVKITQIPWTELPSNIRRIT